MHSENQNNNSLQSNRCSYLREAKDSFDTDHRHTITENIQELVPDQGFHHFSSDLDFLQQESLRTISCRSLDPSSQSSLFQPVRETPSLATHKNNSETSLPQEEKDIVEENQRKMIAETRGLLLSDPSQESSSEISVQSLSNQIFSHKKIPSRGPFRIQKISKVKELKNCVKKLQRASLDEINGNFRLKGSEGQLMIKDGSMKIISCDKGVLKSIVLQNEEQQIFVRPKNYDNRRQDIIVDHWDKQKEQWVEYFLVMEIPPF